uniref:C2H2-type domain-containing protein n=1 Tax=Knipowitschia caucasica TaxID=637954 RepID=A0AAV2LYE5_KNICA
MSKRVTLAAVSACHSYKPWTKNGEREQRTSGAERERGARIHCRLFGKMGDDRPFVCTAPGCGQRFTNEDHLAVHKHKHEMTLKFGPARTDSVIIADQTPTPTRFLKNCEEVGLFNELASSFDHDDDEKKNKSSDTPPRSSAPTPTIVRPGSLPLHLGFDAFHPTMPSPTSVITQAPPSNRTLGSAGTLRCISRDCPTGGAKAEGGSRCLPVQRHVTTPLWLVLPMMAEGAAARSDSLSHSDACFVS